MNSFIYAHITKTACIFSLIPALILAEGCTVRVRAGARTTADTDERQPQEKTTGETTNLQAEKVEGETATTAETNVGVETGVTGVSNECKAEETCNGIDDNCDGKIDEGCGYESGDIQVTLSWAGDADLDLYVVDPKGEEIWYKHASSATGGKLDADARGGCGDNPKGRVENIFWSNVELEKGEYKVFVNHWGGSKCSTASGATAATLSVSINGQSRAFSFTSEPGQKKSILKFEI